MNSEDAAACIQAALLMPKVGRKTVRKIFEDLPEEVSDRSSFRDHLVRIGGSFPRVPSTTEEEVRELFEEADELIAKTTKYEKGSVLSMLDFPDRLKRMDDPPVLLHCLGDRSLLEGKSAAVIGTRNPTDYGREAALAFGRLLAEKGRTVVSGLALGCDTGGHLGCLEAGGGTVAVMAHGLDTVYPPQNRDLAERIVAENGLLLSEYPMGVSGRRNFFVERDRIQAALSDLVVVVETGLKGGTLHTVGFAEKGGVPVHALDHPEEYREEDQVLGNRNLIEDGRATPILHDEDSVAEALEGSAGSDRKDPSESVQTEDGALPDTSRPSDGRAEGATPDESEGACEASLSRPEEILPVEEIPARETVESDSTDEENTRKDESSPESEGGGDAKEPNKPESQSQFDF